MLYPSVAQSNKYEIKHINGAQGVFDVNAVTILALYWCFCYTFLTTHKRHKGKNTFSWVWQMT